jgi:hypothetical protein
MQNPGQGQVVLEVSLANPEYLELVILSASGRKTTTLLHSRQPSGVYRVAWSGTAQNGSQLAAGLYFVRLAFNEGVICRKVVLNR